jgi:hypothetical protein
MHLFGAIYLVLDEKSMKIGKKFRDSFKHKFGGWGGKVLLRKSKEIIINQQTRCKFGI